MENVREEKENARGMRGEWVGALVPCLCTPCGHMEYMEPMLAIAVLLRDDFVEVMLVR